MNTFQLAVVIWLALLALLGVSVGAATLLPGAVAHGASLLCAFAMAALIFVWFMGLHTADGLLRVFALAAVLWLCLLMGITLLDYIERDLGVLQWGAVLAKCNTGDGASGEAGARQPPACPTTDRLHARHRAGLRPQAPSRPW